jgi:hypothetical protein
MRKNNPQNSLKFTHCARASRSRCQLHRKRESLALDCDAICGGVNVGDAFRQVEGLVMVSGSESA